jgi:hypothetical protein
MKRFILAASLAAVVPAAFAQAPAAAPSAAPADAPKPKCEDPGPYPSRGVMRDVGRRETFLKAIDAYKTCMLNFVEERKAVIRVNETAARTAIESFNARMKSYNDEQEKAKAD